MKIIAILEKIALCFRLGVILQDRVEAPCLQTAASWGPEAVLPALGMQMDMGSQSPSWELSPAQLVSHSCIGAAQTTLYGLPQPGCPESSLCACDLPSLFPPCWGLGSPTGYPSQKSFEFCFTEPASIISPMVGMWRFGFRVSWIWTKYCT